MQNTSSFRFQSDLKNIYGFSLIELLVVLAMIALVTSIGVPSYQRYFKEARANTAKSDLLMMASRLENYRQDKLTYKGVSAESIYSSTSPTGKNKALFNLKIIVDEKGLNYLLEAQAIENSQARGDGVFWYNPIGKNCHFTDSKAPYKESCENGEEWD